MKLATYVRKLKDRNGNYVVPATRSTGVYLNDNQTLQGWIDNMEDKKFDLLTVYPVGAIFQSTSDASPASLFGSNWERLYDRFLVGAGDTYGVGQTGGETSHTLTTWEMPTHNHGFANNSYTLGNGGTGWEGDLNLVIGGHEDYIVCFKTGPLGRPNAAFASSSQHNHTIDGGNGGAHNNLPPYYAVNIWRRAA